MKVIVFEDEGWASFSPVSRIRHLSQLRWGSKSLLDSMVSQIPDATDVGLWGRPELAEVSREELHRDYNQKAPGQVFLVNARARPEAGLLSMASRTTPFAAVSNGTLVAARISGARLAPGVVRPKDVAKLSRGVDRLKASPESLFSGYWDLVRSNGLAIAAQARRFDDAQSLPDGLEVRGPISNVMVEGGADIESHVTFDVRLGPLVVEKGASIESFSRIMGPCFLGSRSKLYSAQIGGGTSIFESCKVGGQVENSIIMPYSNKAHLGYVGDSYIGGWVNLGAGSTFSNLKNTYGNVRVGPEGTRTDTGQLKLGPLVGDMCKVSIGALVHAGKTLGTGSHISGLVSKNVPPFTYYDGGRGKMVELLVDSVVETQRRMMDRRGVVLSRALETLLRRAFSRTAQERRKAGAKKGPLS